MVKFQSDLPNIQRIRQIVNNHAGIYRFAFFLIGISFLGVSSINLYHGIQSTHWPAADGRVTSFWVVSAGRPGTGLKVEREYEVGGKKYVSKRISFTRNYRDMDYAYTNYPIGSSAKVYYNPNNPAQAVLEPGVTWHIFSFLFLGFLFLVGWLWLSTIQKGHLPKTGDHCATDQNK